MYDELSSIVVRAKQGDKEAFDELYRQTQRMVYFTALKLTQDEESAKDISQDTYLKVFSELPGLHDDRVFPAWVKSIAANTSKNYLLKKKPLLFASDEEEEAAISSVPEIGEEFLPEEYAMRREKARLVMEIVDRLPQTQRMSVILFYYDGFSVVEVAKIMETSEGTTKSRLNYARKTIKEEIERLEKKGTRLYAVPLFLLSRILHKASEEYDMPPEVSDAVARQIPKQAQPSGDVSVSPATDSALTQAVSAETIALSANASGMAVGLKVVIAVAAIAAVAAASVAIWYFVGKSPANVQQPSPVIFQAVVESTPESASQSASSASDPGPSAVVSETPVHAPVGFEEYLGKNYDEITAELGVPSRISQLRENGNNLIYNFASDNADKGAMPKYMAIMRDGLCMTFEVYAPEPVRGAEAGMKYEDALAAWKRDEGLQLKEEGREHKDSLGGSVYTTRFALGVSGISYNISYYPDQTVFRLFLMSSPEALKRLSMLSSPVPIPTLEPSPAATGPIALDDLLDMPDDEDIAKALGLKNTHELLDASKHPGLECGYYEGYYFIVTGEGYSVAGVVVGMSKSDAEQKLSGFKLRKDDPQYGSSYELGTVKEYTKVATVQYDKEKVSKITYAVEVPLEDYPS